MYNLFEIPFAMLLELVSQTLITLIFLVCLPMWLPTIFAFPGGHQLGGVGKFSFQKLWLQYHQLDQPNFSCKLFILYICLIGGYFLKKNILIFCRKCLLLYSIDLGCSYLFAMISGSVFRRAMRDLSTEEFRKLSADKKVPTSLIRPQSPGLLLAPLQAHLHP